MFCTYRDNIICMKLQFHHRKRPLVLCLFNPNPLLDLTVTEASCPREALSLLPLMVLFLCICGLLYQQPGLFEGQHETGRSVQGGRTSKPFNDRILWCSPYKHTPNSHFLLTIFFFFFLALDLPLWTTCLIFRTHCLCMQQSLITSFFHHQASKFQYPWIPLWF